jgi:RNA polymerase sigma-70 factor (ECF subfamily)
LEDWVQIIEVLHRKYARLLYDKCVRMLGDRQEAEDAVQETFMSAYRAIGQFREGESHLPWLYRIATNVCLKIIRTRKRKGAVPTDKFESSVALRHPGVTEAYYRGILEKGIQMLDERDLQILTLHLLDGLTQTEVASAIGISRRSVVKRLSGIREKFGGLLEDVDE